MRASSREAPASPSTSSQGATVSLPFYSGSRGVRLSRPETMQSLEALAVTARTEVDDFPAEITVSQVDDFPADSTGTTRLRFILVRSSVL